MNTRNKYRNTRRNREQDFDLPSSIEEQEPMVTVYKRGSYIDPIQAKKELMELTSKTNETPKGNIFHGVKSIFGKIFSRSKESEEETRAGRNGRSKANYRNESSPSRPYKPKRPQKKVNGYSKNRNRAGERNASENQREETSKGNDTASARKAKPKNTKRNPRRRKK